MNLSLVDQDDLLQKHINISAPWSPAASVLPRSLPFAGRCGIHAQRLQLRPLCPVLRHREARLGLNVAERGDADAVKGAGGVLLSGEVGDVDASALAVLCDIDLCRPRLGPVAPIRLADAPVP